MSANNGIIEHRISNKYVQYVGMEIKRESLNVSGHSWENIKGINSVFQNESVGWERKNWRDIEEKKNEEILAKKSLKLREKNDSQIQWVQRREILVQQEKYKEIYICWKWIETKEHQKHSKVVPQKDIYLHLRSAKNFYT